jgi:hypothetical protein
MEIRPVDLPELRGGVVDSIRNCPDYSPWQQLITSGRSPFRSARSMPSAREHAVIDESLVYKADLFHVTGEMTELAKAASRSLPDFQIQYEDLPVMNGFIAFAEPLVTVDFGEPAVPSPVRAACWNVYEVHGVSYLWIKFFSDRESWLPVTAKAVGMSTRELTYNRRVVPRLSPMLGSDCLGPIGSGAAGLPINAVEEGFRQAARTVRAAWLLMQQSIARISEAEPNRAARKRLTRAGHESKAVRVIELRRPKNSSGHGDSDREYHHQWIVRGHWRQQWHPKREVHRPVWIAPHVKGPEGAPLIGGEKVYAWKR